MSASVTADTTLIRLSPTNQKAGRNFPRGTKFRVEEIKYAKSAAQRGEKTGEKRAEMINFRMGKGECTAELRKGALPDACIN